MTRNPAVPTPRHASRLTLLALAASLAACSTLDGTLAGPKVDYRSGATKTEALDIPPDLTQLARDTRYQPQSGAVSASSSVVTGSAPATAATATASAAARPTAPQQAAVGQPLVAPVSVGEMRILRDGNQRWLFVPSTAEQIWPQLRGFWQENGFNIETERAEAGVMETGWAENRANIPQDGLRRIIGRALDSLYDSGTRDRFRTRVERVPGGTEVFITHTGMQEIYVDKAQRDATVWQPRPSDPQLEAQFLTLLMVRLGAPAQTPVQARAGQAPAAAAAAAAAPVVVEQPARARLVTGQPAASIEVDDGFDRAWRRVGLALDRSGFTVEDRDRAAGLYFVRYVDPKIQAKEPGFFDKMLGTGPAAAPPARYRIAVKSTGEKSMVSVLDGSGAPENGEIGQRIVGLLVTELR